jgi:hypothetical protein
VDSLVRLAISRGRLGARKVNVRTQQRDPHSLLSWFHAMIATLRECPEIGVGVCPVSTAIARLGVERLWVPLDPAAQRTPALMNLGLLIRRPIGLIVRKISIDQGAGAGRPGGHAVGAFLEPLQRFGVAERHRRF